MGELDAGPRRRRAGAPPNVGRPVRWAVAGGWAVDLFLGRTTRDHEDLEIVVLTDDVPPVLDSFRPPEWTWSVASAGRLHPLDSPVFADSHQTWLWSAADQAFVIDMFRDLHDGDAWICRRDRTIRRPWRSVVRRASLPGGTVPYLAPEIVLLFKAKHQREKDEIDFTRALPELDAAARAWLADALRRVHPDHDWLVAIDEIAPGTSVDH